MRAKIHTLMFLGFTALALPLAMTGCIVDNTSSPPPCDNRLTLTWSIDDNLGSSITCEGAGANSVQVTAAGVVSQFPCKAYAGYTFNEPGGNYLVDVQLIAFNGAVLSEAAANWSVPSCGGLDLGPVAFCIGSACPP
ncbi:MAG TPA: hypothetical protein VFH68_15530 [Polyangia bacterium]|jgi:hypothetical protein|nr:hypothetical protein [Polyangia bacterium]